MFRTTCILTTVAVLSLATSAHALQIKLTAQGLGLTTDPSVKFNGGSVVDPDLTGFGTSTTTGVGSVITIIDDGTGLSGIAGIPSASFPVIVTMTAESRLDNFPTTDDYRAGVFSLSEQKGNDGKHPDKGEGLGVRAFTVIVGGLDAGLRDIDGGTGRAIIEGSKHVSGGTDLSHGPDPTLADLSSPNGADHVDEAVYFDFNPSLMAVDADSFAIRITELEAIKDVMTVVIKRQSGADITLSNIDVTHPAFVEQGSGDKVFDLDFSLIAGLLDDDVLTYVSVRAEMNGEIGEDLDKRKSHFFLNGLDMTVTPIPEPSTLMLGILASMGMLLPRRRRKNRNSTDGVSQPTETHAATAIIGAIKEKMIHHTASLQPRALLGRGLTALGISMAVAAFMLSSSTADAGTISFSGGSSFSSNSSSTVAPRSLAKIDMNTWETEGLSPVNAREPKAADVAGVTTGVTTQDVHWGRAIRAVRPVDHSRTVDDRSRRPHVDQPSDDLGWWSTTCPADARIRCLTAVTKTDLLRS
jgi:hypothetical protein